MKLVRNIFLFTFLIFITSCSEDFLNREPYGFYTPEDYFRNEVEVTQAVNGLYPVVRGFYTGANWVLGEFRSDNTTFQYNAADRGSESFESHDYFLSDAANGTFSSLWDNAYNGIARANFILESIEQADFDDQELKAVREGEARFVRAFCYYFLVKYFGDVPFIDRVYRDVEAAGDLRREDENRIIDEIIIPDLSIAKSSLPMKWDLSNDGRASKAAALMLESRIHFYRNDYQEAIPLLQEIIDSKLYSLESNYRDVFSPENESSNSEVIFAVQFNSSAGQGAGFYINWLPNNSGTDITGEGGVFINALNGKNIPTRDMINAYEANDKRKEASIAPYIFKENNVEDTVYYIRKYLFPPVLPTGTDNNLPIFRYAETLLMYIEAKAIAQGDFSDPSVIILNEIRQRAGLPLAFAGNANPNLDVSSAEKFINLIRQERRVEMAFEGERFHDLVRYGTLEETMRAHGEEQRTYQDFLGTFPGAYMNIPTKIAIPINEVLVYGYEQNPGW